MRSVRKHVGFALLSTLLFISNQSIASDLSYSFFEVDYLDSRVDIDGVDVDGDGYGLYASTDVSGNLALFFSYEDQDFDFDIEGKSTTFGIDYHTPISATGDLVISFAAVEVEVSQPLVGAEDDTGNLISVGLRNQNSKGAEMSIAVSRVDVFDNAESTLALGMGFGATRAIQVTLGLNLSEDTNVFVLGIRTYY